MDVAITLVVLALVVIGLVTNKVSPASGIVGASALLFVLGVIEADQAFGGFANSAPLTVAALYVVAGGVARTGALSPCLLYTSPSPRDQRGSRMPSSA